ncbi:MAG TPA: SDR family oxidoreductase [Candidatus Saccharimonadales bacterium]|nr:SDR family oxidoreductase [Candidatus Saccharimonadales bacterium]
MKKVVVITGASSGLGKEIAKQLLTTGNYVLIVTGRNNEGFEEFKSSPDVTIIIGDLTKKTTIDLLEHAVKEQGKIDILINNAGITYINPITENSEQKIDELLAINLKAPMLLTQRLYPLMVKQQSGHIINVNSAAGKEGKPNHTIYSAAKFGLKGFTDALRHEAKSHNIRVTSFHPGGINTPLYRNLPHVPKEKYMDPLDIAKLLIQLIQTDPSLSPDEIVITRMTK